MTTRRCWLAALRCLLTGTEPATARRRRTRRGTDTRAGVGAEEAAGYLRANEIALTYDQATGTMRAGAAGATKTITGKAS
jgi:hypothetical protein